MSGRENAKFSVVRKMLLLGSGILLKLLLVCSRWCRNAQCCQRFRQKHSSSTRDFKIGDAGGKISSSKDLGAKRRKDPKIRPPHLFLNASCAPRPRNKIRNFKIFRPLLLSHCCLTPFSLCRTSSFSAAPTSPLGPSVPRVDWVRKAAALAFVAKQICDLRRL